MANTYLVTLLSLLLIVSMVGLVSAETSYIFKEGEEVNYRFRCFDASNEYCSDTTLLVISVEYPNGSNALDNYTMTHNPTYYNVSLPTDTTGEYDCIISSPTTNGTVSEFAYEVTGTGYEFTQGRSIFYIAILALLVFLFVVDIFAIGRLPIGNTTDAYGNILDINHLKYLRPVLYVVGWTILVSIVYITSNISYAYLGSELVASVMFNLFRVMFVLTLPIVFIWFIFLFIQIFRDNETKRMIEMGIDDSI